MVVTTISCDATILRCSKCTREVAVAVTVSAAPGTCTCGAPMVLDRGCAHVVSLRRDGFIRCIAENRDGWRCEDGGRDFCPDHAQLANPYRIRTTPEDQPKQQELR